MDPTTAQQMSDDFKASWNEARQRVRMVGTAAFAIVIFGGLGVGGFYPEWSMFALACTALAALMQAGALSADIKKKEDLEQLLDHELTRMAHERGAVRSSRKKTWTPKDINEAVDFVLARGFIERLYLQKTQMLSEMPLLAQQNPIPDPNINEVVADEVGSELAQQNLVTDAPILDDAPPLQPQLPRSISYATKPQTPSFLD